MKKLHRSRPHRGTTSVRLSQDNVLRAGVLAKLQARSRRELLDEFVAEKLEQHEREHGPLPKQRAR